MIKKFLNNNKFKNDILLVAVIIILAIVGILLLNLTKQKGNIVSVKVDGKEISRYMINQTVDTVIYTGNNDNQENHLVIKDGKVHISQANCPDKICVHHRKIDSVNESIVCLPHKVVVEIISQETSNDLDMAV